VKKLYAYYSGTGFSQLKYCHTDYLYGWFTLEYPSIITNFILFEENGLVFVIPYTIFYGCIYTDNKYCIGQVNLSGTITEAYKWEERLVHHEFSPELVSKIHEYLQKVKK